MKKGTFRTIRNASHLMCARELNEENEKYDVEIIDTLHDGQFYCYLYKVGPKKEGVENEAKEGPTKMKK